jgi:hypothetical protein
MQGIGDHLLGDEKGLKHKKKVLGYLLRKNPKEF